MVEGTDEVKDDKKNQMMKKILSLLLLFVHFHTLFTTSKPSLKVEHMHLKKEHLIEEKE